MKAFYKIAIILLIIGGINWGLVGLFQFDLVGYLFGGMSSVVSRIIFAVVGLSALVAIPALFSSSGEEQGQPAHQE